MAKSATRLCLFRYRAIKSVKQPPNSLVIVKSAENVISLMTVKGQYNFLSVLFHNGKKVQNKSPVSLVSA